MSRGAKSGLWANKRDVMNATVHALCTLCLCIQTYRMIPGCADARREFSSAQFGDGPTSIGVMRRAHSTRRPSGGSGGSAAVAGEYSTCSRGAPAASPSCDSAVLLPDPVTIRTIELPLVQPGRLTIS